MLTNERGVVLVTGVTGQVGWGVAQRVLQQGGRVVAPVRRAAQAAELSKEERALVVEVPRFDEEGLARLRDQALARFGRIDHVFAPLGAWWQKGASLEQPPHELRELLATYVEAPWALLKATAPALAESKGSFTFVTGAAGEHVIPGAGLLVTAVAAQMALSRVMRAELQKAPFRVNEVRIACRIERDPRPGVVPSLTAAADFEKVMLGDQRGRVLRYTRPGALEVLDV